MKKLLPLLVMLLLIGALNKEAAAQDANTTPEDIIASSALSRNIVKLIGALPTDFKPMKGELVAKIGDSVSVYGVNDMSTMIADKQYVMVKSNGKAYYIASFMSDQKKLSMSFSAFIHGVTTVTNADDSYAIGEDKSRSTADKVVYTISHNGIRVGSYTMETKKKEGTMIIGVL